MSRQNNEPEYYQEEDDFLEILYINSEYLVKKFCQAVISLSIVGLLCLLVFVFPPIIIYEINSYKGVNQNLPVIFEVNGVSYPDINNLQDFENSGINLDSIPVEENN